MYGAFWCSHCFEQKQTFGKEAMKEFPYVECFPSGWKRVSVVKVLCVECMQHLTASHSYSQGVRMVAACEEAGVRAFPTWNVNGRVVEGELSLDALEKELSTPVGQPSPNIQPEAQ